MGSSILTLCWSIYLKGYIYNTATFLVPKWIFANSVDPDQKLQIMASNLGIHLGIHCLPESKVCDIRYKWAFTSLMYSINSPVSTHTECIPEWLFHRREKFTNWVYYNKTTTVRFIKSGRLKCDWVYHNISCQYTGIGCNACKCTRIFWHNITNTFSVWLKVEFCTLKYKTHLTRFIR